MANIIYISSNISKGAAILASQEYNDFISALNKLRKVSQQYDTVIHEEQDCYAAKIEDDHEWKED